MLEGDRLVTTPYAIDFRKDIDNHVLCSKSLNGKDLEKFRQAVRQDYYFQVRGAADHTLKARQQGWLAPGCGHRAAGCS